MKKIFLLFFAISSSIAFSQNALHFDGSNDFVQTTFTGVNGTANRTFEAWINVDVNAPVRNLAITDYGSQTAGDRNTFLVSSSRGLSFIAGGVNTNIGSGANVITPGQWTHVAFVLNNGTGYLYVNGVQVGTGNLSGVTTPNPGTNKMKIGQRVSGGSIHFAGMIDEVRIWNVARTPAELQANDSTELCGGEPGLVAYYRLNEGTANGTNTGVRTAVDEVAGKDGTLSGFTLSGTSSNWVTGMPITTPTPALSTQTVDLCDGDSIVVGSSVYDSTGLYSDTLMGMTGCDSAIVVTNLTVAAPVDVSTTTDMSTLTVSANNTAATSYQWLNCSDTSIIVGDTGSSYMVTANGSYAVAIAEGNCADTSDCVSFTTVGLDEVSATAMLNIYPNPAINDLTVDTDINNYNLRVINTTGHVVIEETGLKGITQIDISQLAKGSYIIEVMAEGQRQRKMLMKY